MSFDFSELEKLTADLGVVPDGVMEPLKKAFNVTSFKVKKSAVAKVSRRKGLAQAAGGIDFEVTARKADIESEIGYSKERRSVAKLGNIAEFGTPGSVANNFNGVAPGNELQRSLHEQESDFLKGVSLAVEDSLKKAGLA